jgi:lysophospholipase L1-like esterase
MCSSSDLALSNCAWASAIGKRDGLHPSDLGYNKMGDAIDLSLFE